MMGIQHEIVDQEARTRALDPRTSFIVQAPAGSGKTGLLTQRFLVLLATVDMPEEIIAITFTRKAAAEMRQRILLALEHARSDQPAAQDYEKHNRELARQVLARDRKQGWHLLENPARLRILTIDSLCTTLAHQMPLLSRFGATPAICEDAAPLYLEAARRTIGELESGAEWSDAIAHLIQHLDNRLDKLQSLIATMLARRDQWLRHVADPDHPRLERKNLEAAMARLVTDALRDLVLQTPAACRPELIALARFAADKLQGTTSPLAACHDLQALPDVQVTDRERWEGLAELLLTKEGAWRKSVNKRQGFPASGSAENQQEKAHLSEMKQRMTALLESLQGEWRFRDSLALLRKLPAHQYTHEEWETLQALVGLLRVAAAHLELVFSEQGQVDFPALAQAAIRALGDPDAPTDLALALDYRIRHLLVDEFQDTSFNQYQLLKRLMAGWQPDDGRTLFVVGDPMQSIYRFREAEVGLFLATRAHGIGQIALEFLRLTVNFRSQQGIVDWINEHFTKVMATDDNIADGAVSYAPSAPFHPPLAQNAVTVHPSLERDDMAEACQVVAIVQRAKAEQPDGRIAILVRGRTHLVQIVTQLKRAGLRFQAVEIERLAQRPVIQDLLALTRALNHIADRIAWLALLRAPYCGLTLDDLHALAADDIDRPMIDLLHQPQRVMQLSDDGRRRIARVLPLLDVALSEQARCSLRNYVEGVWIALGGPACVTDETDIEDAEVYFQLLETLGGTGDITAIQALDRQVEQLFALPDIEADDSLQLMTIHRAKGLEFDTVIVPGLGRSPRRDDATLLNWLERVHESDVLQSDSSDLLLAPISAQGDNKNRMVSYLQRLDKMKGRYEDGRLLYVAATRAKQRLHLLGQLDSRGQSDHLELKPPAQDSLLSRLWPVVENDFRSLLTLHHGETIQSDEHNSLPRRSVARTRLALDWSLPAPPQSIQLDHHEMDSRTSGELLEFDWAGETARHMGTVVHRLLQQIANTGINHMTPADTHRFEQIAHNMLIRLGVPADRLKNAIAEITDALRAAMEDRRGRWILAADHRDARCELALSGVRDGHIEHIIVDRTFVDEHGTRWIIDYKTSTHSGGGIDEFLDREQQRYRPQLERYAAIMRKMEQRPIRLGLYFPLLGGWREWSF